MSTHDLTQERNWKPLTGIETMSFPESKNLSSNRKSQDHNQTPGLKFCLFRFRKNSWVSVTFHYCFGFKGSFLSIVETCSVCGLILSCTTGVRVS